MINGIPYYRLQQISRLRRSMADETEEEDGAALLQKIGAAGKLALAAAHNPRDKHIPATAGEEQAQGNPAWARRMDRSHKVLVRPRRRSQGRRAEAIRQA
jgi:hypothetical protein